MTKKYGFLFLIFTSFFGLSALAEINLDTANEYEYLHCIDSTASDQAIITHFLLDVKNDNVNALYSASAVKSRIAKNISDWKLIDDSNQLVQTDPHFDVYIVSEKSKMTFNLNVMDDGGYSLSGFVNSDSGQIQLTCLDISLEK